MKKKVLLSIFIVACIGLFLGAGVYSLFQDVETTTGNTFAAGTLDLQVGDTNPTTERIDIPALKPGDTGTAASWHMQNLGTVPGNLNITTSAITNNENTRSPIETAAGDSTGGAAEGELGGSLMVAFWTDHTNDGWSSGDYYLTSTGTTVPWASGATLPPAAYSLLDNYNSDTWSNVEINRGFGSIGYFKVDYNLPLATTNVIQSDNSTFDITFTLTQT